MRISTTPLLSFSPLTEASSIDRTQQSRFHLMTREEPFLETLWLQNLRTIDKVQIIDRSNCSIYVFKNLVMASGSVSQQPKNTQGARSFVFNM
jgi:hypothetical protein